MDKKLALMFMFWGIWSMFMLIVFTYSIELHDREIKELIIICDCEEKLQGTKYLNDNPAYVY